MDMQQMYDKAPNGLFGLSPATYGIASLAAAFVADWIRGQVVHLGIDDVLE